MQKPASKSYDIRNLFFNTSTHVIQIPRFFFLKEQVWFTVPLIEEDIEELKKCMSLKDLSHYRPESIVTMDHDYTIRDLFIIENDKKIEKKFAGFIYNKNMPFNIITPQVMYENGIEITLTHSSTYWEEVIVHK